MKNKLIFLSLFFSLTLIGCSSPEQGESESINKKSLSEQTYLVQTGSLNDSSSYISYIQSDISSSLSFKLPGRIISMNVEKGDSVSKGDILARVDTDEASNNYQTVSQSLKSTQRMYNNTADLYDSQIQTAESKLKESERGLNLAISNYSGTTQGLKDTKQVTQDQIKSSENQITQAKAGLRTLENKLKNIKQNLNQERINLYENAKTALSSSSILITNIMDFTDKLLGVSDEREDDNDDFEVYLGAKNNSLKTNTERLWEKINKKVLNFKEKNKTLINELNIEINNNEISEDFTTKVYNQLVLTKKIIIDIRALLSNTYTVLDKSVVSSSFTQNTIQKYTSQTIEYQNNLEKVLLSAEGQYLLGVDGTLQSIDNFNNQYETQIQTLNDEIQIAKAKLETAKSRYNQYKSQSSSEVNSVTTKENIAEQKIQIATEKYNQAKSSLNSLKKQKESKLAEIQTQLERLKGDQKQAGIKNNDGILKAPFDGIIVDKKLEVGSLVDPSIPIYTLAKNKNLKVTIGVNQKEIDNIKLNSKADIYSNSLDKWFTGVVSNISPMSNIRSKKIPVDVKITSKDIQNLNLGMYVKVFFKTNKKTDIIIPQDLIKYRYGQAYVLITNEDGIKKQNIDVNKCDSTYCFINGLQTGEKVIK